jgi:excisionase family DNA binding protein
VIAPPHVDAPAAVSYISSDATISSFESEDIMPARSTDEFITATPDEAAAIRRFHDALKPSAHRGREAVLTDSSGHAVPVPEPLYETLRRASGLMAEGRAVALVAVDKELSTQEAADYLNVSRPFLVKLLEQGEIPFTHVGRYRRVRLDDLQHYRERRDRRRKEILDDLTRMGQQTGGYR